MRLYLGIEGPIGVGKTTLANLLQPILEATLMLEEFEENPFLGKFYDDPACYALQTQLFFLMTRYRQQAAYAVAGNLLIGDYIFAKNDLFARYTLSGPEHDLYQDISATLAGNLMQPTLVVYLRGRLNTLMTRIAQRNRPYEQGLSMREYMDKLVWQYEDYFSDYNDSPVLTVDTDDIDVVNSDADRAWLTQHVIDHFREVTDGIPKQERML